MTEKRRAPESVCRELCEAVDSWYGDSTGEQPGWCPESKAVFRAVKAYRAATAPLRTRGSVEAEIVHVARIWSGSHREPDQRWLERLCSEPIADEPEARP